MVTIARDMRFIVRCLPGVPEIATSVPASRYAAAIPAPMPLLLGEPPLARSTKLFQEVVSHKFNRLP
jgi:hypothetical protein